MEPSTLAGARVPGDIADETFDSLRERIRDRYADLSPHLQRIAKLALDQPNQLALAKIAMLAGLVHVQPSTLIRFAKEFGYDGFTSMQQVFRLRLIEGAPVYREQIYGDRSAARDPGGAQASLHECIDTLIASLERLRRDTRPEEIERAAELCLSARHIYVAGLRRSHPIATYFSYGMMRLEQQCSLLDFSSGMAGQQVANMSHDDLLVAIAFPPYSPPVVDIVRDAHIRSLKVLSVTDSQASPLALGATSVFYVDAEGSSPFRPISGAIGLIQAIILNVRMMV
jgi:DNA-binding MurR/RpiR family transcriptional regulator